MTRFWVMPSEQGWKVRAKRVVQLDQSEKMRKANSDRPYRGKPFVRTLKMDLNRMLLAAVFETCERIALVCERTMITLP
jgi:hypothetical protein